ncbi:MAG: hypothetical protein WBG24_08795 [Syntrophobacteria bacterium]
MSSVRNSILRPLRQAPRDYARDRQDRQAQDKALRSGETGKEVGGWRSATLEVGGKDKQTDDRE